MDDGHRYLDLPGLSVRWLYAVFVTFATFNYSGYSYYHWLTDVEAEAWLLKFAVGAMLAFGFYNITDIAFRSLQPTGTILIGAICGFLSWYIIDEGWIVVRDAADLTTAIQFTVAAVFAFGLSYSHIHYRIGGVKQVEDI